MVSLAFSLSQADQVLEMLLRFVHVIIVITWIGASFYFVLLDNSLRSPERVHGKEGADDEVGGELWSVHGGGFYHTQRYRVAPGRLPTHLHFASPWPAYMTWVSGLALLVVLYYWNAGSYLIDREVADLGTGLAIGISLALLPATWVIYDLLCRGLQRRQLLLGALVFVLVSVAAYGVSNLFSARASYVQLGAMLGTVMSANVFFVILPAHRELVAAKRAGRPPDGAIAHRATQRSVHNTYLTLPVLFAMLGNHFPLAYGNAHGWAVLLAVMLVSAWVRHIFVVRQRGRTSPAMALVAAVAVVAIAIWITPDDGDAQAGDETDAPPAETLALGRQVFAAAGCASCHTLRAAGSTATVGPNLDEARPSLALVRERVTHGQGAMPSFRNELSRSQIEAVAAYVSSAAGG